MRLSDRQKLILIEMRHGMKVVSKRGYPHGLMPKRDPSKGRSLQSLGSSFTKLIKFDLVDNWNTRIGHWELTANGKEVADMIIRKINQEKK